MAADEVECRQPHRQTPSPCAFGGTLGHVLWSSGESQSIRSELGTGNTPRPPSSPSPTSQPPKYRPPLCSVLVPPCVPPLHPEASLGINAGSGAWKHGAVPSRRRSSTLNSRCSMKYRRRDSSPCHPSSWAPSNAFGRRWWFVERDARASGRAEKIVDALAAIMALVSPTVPNFSLVMLSFLFFFERTTRQTVGFVLINREGTKA